MPHRFAGDVATHGRLLEGPVVNFNVMYRETLTEALTSVVRGRLTLDVPPDATVLVVALDGPRPSRTPHAALAPYDAAVVTGESPGVLRADGHTALVTLRSGTRSA